MKSRCHEKTVNLIALLFSKLRLLNHIFGDHNPINHEVLAYTCVLFFVRPSNLSPWPYYFQGHCIFVLFKKVVDFLGAS